jgi:hypothetical protein
MLILRLLASCTSTEVQDACHKFLRHARRVTFRWLQKLKTSFNATTNNDKNAEQQILICEISALVRQTYNVDPEQLSKVFFTPEDISILLEAAISLHENQPPKLDEAPYRVQLLFLRDRRLAHALEARLKKLIGSDWSPFDRAIRAVWPGYRPSATRIMSPTTSWFSCHTAATGGRAEQYVDFNALDGALLVDGKQLGRLPDAYVTHPLYLRTFGQVSVHSILLDG